MRISHRYRLINTLDADTRVLELSMVLHYGFFSGDDTEFYSKTVIDYLKNHKLRPTNSVMRNMYIELLEYALHYKKGTVDFPHTLITVPDITYFYEYAKNWTMLGALFQHIADRLGSMLGDNTTILCQDKDLFLFYDLEEDDEECL